MSAELTRTDLVLVMCPGWGVSQPPVGISYLASFLQRRGFSVKGIDLSLELYKVFPEKKYWDLNYPEYFVTPQLFEEYIAPILQKYIDSYVKKILSYNSQVVGFSMFMSNRIVSFLLARKLKQVKPDIFIVGGGPEVTRIKRVMGDGIASYAPLDRDSVLGGAFDVYIDGEGEQALEEILILERGQSEFRHIASALWVHNGSLVINQPRKLMDNLDVLPPPTFDDYDLSSYLRYALPVVTSRGCVNRCTFCADSPLWKMYRCRSADKVYEEILTLADKYCREQFEITDSIFNGDMNRIEQLCDMLIKSGRRLYWSAKVTARKEMTSLILRKMRQAGCTSLAYGIESGSPSVLKDMRKNPDLSMASNVIRDTFKAGIQANCFFIIGYPTETEFDFQMTLNFIKDNAAYIHRFDQITGCHIEEDSYLGLHPAKYGIVFKNDGWYSGYSTPAIRQERLNGFRELARQLHKHYQCEVQS